MSIYHSYDEKKLLKLLSEGDQLAFETIYRLFQPHLKNFLLPLTGFSQFETDEVLQDIFFKVWQRKETMVAVDTLKAYLFRMARNRLYDIRDKKLKTKETIEKWSAYSGVQMSDLQDELQLTEYQNLARKAIFSLSPQKRRIFLMKNEMGLSLDEITEALQISKFAVKKHYYESVKLIKNQLNTDLGMDVILLLIATSPAFWHY